jgi:hypothetical protein
MPGIQIVYPSGGLNDSYAHGDQPQLTTRDAENERSVDHSTGRERGAQRPGLEKFVETRIGIGVKVQAVTQVTYDARATTYAHAATAVADDMTVWSA